MEPIPADITVGDDMGEADPFDARSHFVTSDGSQAPFVDIGALERSGICDLGEIPASIRILLEAALRKCDGFLITEEDVLRIATWSPEMTPGEIPFSPSRVILQDFTGVPAVVDIAALRDAMVAMGKDPERVNPQVPVDLVVDHSVQVDISGLFPNARERNLEIEYERNLERYKFLKWGQQSLDNFRAVPPGRGIVHQVNLEWIASVAREEEGIWIPDTLVGTDSHTTMINGLGVLGWGVGGIEAEAVMLGQPIYMLLPKVVGFELKGSLQSGVTATDMTLRVVEMLREHDCVDKFVEFYGSGIAGLSLPGRLPIAQRCPTWLPSTAPHAAFSLWIRLLSTTCYCRGANPLMSRMSSAICPRRACSTPTLHQPLRSPPLYRSIFRPSNPLWQGPRGLRIGYFCLR